MGWRDIERGIVECGSLREKVVDGQGDTETGKNREGVKQESVMFGGASLAILKASHMKLI